MAIYSTAAHAALLLQLLFAFRKHVETPFFVIISHQDPSKHLLVFLCQYLLLGYFLLFAITKLKRQHHQKTFIIRSNHVATVKYHRCFMLTCNQVTPTLFAFVKKYAEEIAKGLLFPVPLFCFHQIQSLNRVHDTNIF